MEEQIEKTEATKEETLVDQARAMAERIEAANKETRELLDRQEKLKVREIIGGQAAAGTPTVEKTPEEKGIESARTLLKGTGYDEILFPEITK